MIAPEKPLNENQRLAALKSLGLLDSPAEERFDAITRTVASTFDVPIVLLTLVDSDRQWFKSNVGIDTKETNRDVSFCGHAILQKEPLIIEDALADERFHDNPLVCEVPNIRFYAGCPLYVKGLPVGTLCLIDRKPRYFSAENKTLLRQYAKFIELELLVDSAQSIDDETALLNKNAFEQLAQPYVEHCHLMLIPVSIGFVLIQGIDLLKTQAPARYKELIGLTADRFKQAFTGFDLLARYDERSIVALQSNASTDSTHQKLDSVIDKIVSEISTQPEFCYLSFTSGVASVNSNQSVSSSLFDAFAKAVQSLQD